MFTVENKFEVGEECYTTYRKPVHYSCPICEGDGSFMHNGYEIRCKKCCGTGKLHDYNQYVMEVCKVRIKRIKVTRLEHVNSIKYMVVALEPMNANVNNRSESNLFKTKEEAEQYCVDVNTEKIKPEF